MDSSATTQDDPLLELGHARALCDLLFMATAEKDAGAMIIEGLDDDTLNSYVYMIKQKIDRASEIILAQHRSEAG